MKEEGKRREIAIGKEIIEERIKTWNKQRIKTCFWEEYSSGFRSRPGCLGT